MLTHRCTCGKTLRFPDDQAGMTTYCSACQAKFKIPWAMSLADDAVAATAGGAVAAGGGIETPQRPQECAFSEVSSMGMILLVVAGMVGVAAGVLGAAASVGAALAVNLVHNLLPVFVFVLPLIIIGLMAVAPAVYGFCVGKATGVAAVGFRHKHPESAGLISFCCAGAGVGLFFHFSNLWVPAGQSFFPDVVLPFVYLMLGGCFTMEWAAEPKPLEIAPWIVYSVLGGSLALGMLGAYGLADDVVRTEFCPDSLDDLAAEELAAAGNE